MQLKITFNICDNSNTIEKVDFKFLENFIETWGGGGERKKKEFEGQNSIVLGKIVRGEKRRRGVRAESVA